MDADYIAQLIKGFRHETRNGLIKESVINQFAQLVDDADATTLEFISCQLSLLQSFMRDGAQNESEDKRQGS